MSSNTLSGSGVTPANTKAQLLHIGTGTAGVSTVRTGDGTATALSFVSGGVQVTGTLNVTTNLTVGGTLTVTGAVMGINVPVFARMSADITAATTTQVTLTPLTFTPINGAVYSVELMLIAQSVSTSTGVQIVNSGGSGTLVMTDPASAFSITAVAGTYAPTSAPIANTNFGILLMGLFTASSTTPVTFDVKSEVAASAVSIKAGSFLKITRIA